MRGLVTKSTGSWYQVRGDDGVLMECRIKGRFRLEGSKNTNVLAVGDFVSFEPEKEKGKGIITGIEPRRNYIIRKSTNLSKQSHILAANLDHAFLLVAVARPRTSAGFIDRFLITAEAYGIPVRIVFSKSDLATSEEQAEMGKLRKVYEAIGYACHELSTVSGMGLNELKSILRGKTSLFAGHSGVGKSSLINALDPIHRQRTGHLSDAHSKGIHTTTNAELFELPSGGAVIDTPGIKEFGMFDIQKTELSHYFPEMRLLFNACKFNSCLHHSELSCAVKDAVAEGKIAVSRYASYVSVLEGIDPQERH